VIDLIRVAPEDKNAFVEHLNAMAFHDPRRYVAEHLYLLGEWLRCDQDYFIRKASEIVGNPLLRQTYLPDLRLQLEDTPSLSVFNPAD